MQRLVIALFALCSIQTWAAELTKTQIEPQVTVPGRKLRDEWDQTQQFCYSTPTEKSVCKKIVDMGEVKIREKGEFSTDPAAAPYIAKLSPQARAEASQYYQLYIRYLAIDDAKNFVVHYAYKSGFGGGQTVFMFGKIVPGAQASAVIDTVSQSPADFIGLSMADAQKGKVIAEDVVSTWLNQNPAQVKPLP